MEINLHGFELWDAIEEVIYKLEDCKIKGVQEISIHGYKSGHILKNYFQSEEFLIEMAREGFKLKRKQSSNQGVSVFEISKIT